MRRRGGGGHGRKPWRGRGACARGGVRRVAKRARRCWCVRPPCWRRPRLCQRRQSPAVAPRGVGAAAPQRHGRHTGEGGGRARSRRATRWPTPSACHAPEPRPMGATHARCLPAPPPPSPRLRLLYGRALATAACRIGRRTTGVGSFDARGPVGHTHHGYHTLFYLP
ncbi:hypothetical protein BU14_0258s0034 [Porphyra umbilicalis]|uniref:Uncharacterized protein n=1 Tax=Porphyra umbilicalis TaxID=2786 RepID=A0A1X6P2D4_PORUM|nr:hypothetical protein BU14_0258s0034 [Porphyra umbilicalis]|eukprot:OSX75029.1 hypothetical protein BU14_0258s0034 [Porphyra umbilicalis]